MKKAAVGSQRSGISGQELTADGRPLTASFWPHRIAWALALAVFPLIWMGGLVTTYNAGMAVPDWPSTFGYWFFYPLHYWLTVWDVFLEHGHRLLGMLVGLLTLALLAALWRCDSRRAARWLGVGALVFVCYQGTLGGLRVVAGEVLLANLHGCTAPAFFAFAAGLAAFTARQWISGPPATPLDSARTLHRGSLCVALLVYLQIVLGAQLRHLLPDAPALWFLLCVWAHVLNAAFTSVAILWLRARVHRTAGEMPLVRRRANLLALLFLTQLVLGALAWLVNYGVPAWFADYVWAVDYTVVTQGRWQGLLSTLHVAVGSLCLVAALSLCLWLHRLLAPSTRT